jgi:hypothetical protein
MQTFESASTEHNYYNNYRSLRPQSQRMQPASWSKLRILGIREQLRKILPNFSQPMPVALIRSRIAGQFRWSRLYCCSDGAGRLKLFTLACCLPCAQLLIDRTTEGWIWLDPYSSPMAETNRV